MDKRSKLVVLIAVLSCWVSVGLGQQEVPPSSSTPPPPSNAGQAPNPTATTPPNQGEEGKPQEQPEMPPLSSGITLEPGSEGSSLSYFLPSFLWTGFFDRFLSQQPGESGTLTRSIFLGNLVLQQVRRRSQLNLDYAAGGQLYGSSYLTNTHAIPPGWGTVQRAMVSDTLRLRRLQLIVGDQFMYLPESSFGFPGFSGLQSFGGGSGGAFLGAQAEINQALLPTESILTGQARRYVNVALGEAQYSPTARSTITATGNFGVINFIDPGFINSRIWTLYVGYNYRLTARDEVSLTFVDYAFGYDTGNRGIVDRGVLLGYGHQFSGRFSVLLSGGPSQIEAAQAQGGSVTRPLWLTNDSVRYRSRIVDLGFRFTQYTSPGSGVFHGAQTDLALLTAGRKISRKLHGSVGIGHAFNQSVAGRGGQGQSQFETWEAGFSLSREYKEHASIYAQYQYRYQVGSSSPCSAVGCSRILGGEVFGAGINWHGRPVRIR